MRLLMLIFLAISALALSAQELHSLTLKYAPGSTCHYRFTDTSTSQGEIFGEEVKVIATNNYLVNMQFVSVAADSSITLLAFYEEAFSCTASPARDTLLNKKGLNGQRTKIVVAKSGKEISRELVGDFDSSTGEIPITVGSRISANFIELPDYKVKTGDKWPVISQDSISYNDFYLARTGTTEYTLDGFEKKNGHRCCKISFIKQFELIGQGNEKNMELFAEGSGEEKGIIWFDEEAGMLIHRESSMQHEMTVAITGPYTMSIPVTQNLKSSVTLVEK